MPNDEGNPNVQMTKDGSEFRHSWFVIDSSFRFRHSAQDDGNSSLSDENTAC